MSIYHLRYKKFRCVKSVLGDIEISKFRLFLFPFPVLLKNFSLRKKLMSSTSAEFASLYNEFNTTIDIFQFNKELLTLEQFCAKYTKKDLQTVPDKYPIYSQHKDLFARFIAAAEPYLAGDTSLKELPLIYFNIKLEQEESNSFSRTFHERNRSKYLESIGREASPAPAAISSSSSFTQQQQKQQQQQQPASAFARSPSPSRASLNNNNSSSSVFASGQSVNVFNSNNSKFQGSAARTNSPSVRPPPQEQQTKQGNNQKAKSAFPVTAPSSSVQQQQQQQQVTRERVVHFVSPSPSSPPAMSGNGNDDDELVELFPGAMIQNDQGIPHKDVISFLDDNYRGPTDATFIWRGGGDLETWEGNISYTPHKKHYVAMFKLKYNETLKKYFHGSEIAGRPSIPVVIPNKDATYYKIELDPVYGSTRAGTASPVNNNNGSTNTNNSNNNNNGGNNNSSNNNNNNSSSQQNNGDGNNNNNNNNSRAVRFEPSSTFSSAPTNNNFRSTSNSNNNNDNDHLNDSDNDSDDGIDRAFKSRPKVSADNVMAETHPSLWQRELQQYSDEAKLQINRDYRRVVWKLRDGWHLRPIEYALVSAWDFHFKCLYIDCIHKGPIRDGMINVMQHTETAILLLQAQKDKRNFIDYQGMAHAEAKESENPSLRHIATFVTKRTGGGGARAGSAGRKRGGSANGRFKFGGGKDICYKCKDAGQSTAFSACKAHNAKLSGNAKAAPQQ